MNVLVVSSKYPPEYAGSGLRAHETYKRLRQKFGIEFEVLCNSVEFKGKEVFLLEGVNVTRIDRSALNVSTLENFHWPLSRAGVALQENFEALETVRYLESAAFDVVHTFGHSASTRAALWWASKRNVPLITEVCNNESSPYQYLPGFGKLLGTPLGWVAHYDLSEQTVVVAISSHLSEMCARHGLEKNVWTRPNPVDEQRFNPSISVAEDPTSLTPFSGDNIILLYVATFKPRKNHRFLVDALSYLPEEYRLVLAGPVDDDGPEAATHRQCVKEVRERIHELGLQSRVHLDVAFVDMAEYLSIADVFCFPSENEAMGTPLLEALCSAVPTVANADEPSFREWIEDGVNGSLAELDAAHWADAVRSVTAIDSSQNQNEASNLLDVVSSEKVDEQYRTLLRALAQTGPQDVVDVESTLSQDRDRNDRNDIHSSPADVQAVGKDRDEDLV